MPINFRFNVDAHTSILAKRFYILWAKSGRMSGREGWLSPRDDKMPPPRLPSEKSLHPEGRVMEYWLTGRNQIN
ncbi:hypothetical protein EMIT093MI4_60168 [Pseudomonas sp. IT-93MI4]